MKDFFKVKNGLLANGVALEKKPAGIAQPLLKKSTSGQFARSQSTTVISTWASKSSGIEASWNSLCWSPELGLFVAVADGGGNRVMTSPDGITWTPRSAAAANAWNSVCW